MEKATPDNADKPKAQEDLKPIEWLYAMIALSLFFGLPAFGVWSLIPDSIRYPVFYGTIYQVGRQHVHVEKEPKDCEWGHAPLGDKDCHYEKQVQTAKDTYGRVTSVLVTWEKVQE